MAFEDFVANFKSEWMQGKGPMSNIIVSSRVRLARNLNCIPFPHRASREQLQEVVYMAQKGFEKLKDVQKQEIWQFFSLDNISLLDRQVLQEKHLISPLLVKGGSEQALILNKNETVSIMINEEDHLRIQCLLSGFQIDRAWEIANLVDDAFENKLDYAFSEEYGYLTSCPTNVGTGMRASVMMHLPGLVMTKQLSGVFSAITRLGLTVRGMYGEGTESLGNMFQISNQITLGVSEEEIISKLKGIIQQIAEQERLARAALMGDNRDKIEDKVWRSFGILKYARLISSQEALQLLSDVRLGVDLGIIEGLDYSLLNQLMVGISPAFLQKIAGREIAPSGRDIRRAAWIRSRLMEDNNGGGKNV